MLKAGFARVDITPPFGNDLSGYYERRLADGTLDPLYLNSVALTVGEETVILMAADYIGIKLDHAAKIRKLIQERTGVPADHILIAALHQHTSPCLADPESRSTALRDKVFIDVLYRRFADAAVMALDDRAEAEMSVGARDVAEPIAFVRRYFTKEAGVVTNPSSKFTLTGRCAEADNTMRLVRFARSGKNDIAILNFSTHPDVIGGTKWSADWPGFARRFLEEDIAGTSCLFFTGCQGDSNHNDYFKPREERLHGGRYEHSAYMGRMVADAAVAVWNEMTPASDDSIFAENRIIYNRTNTEGVEKYDECVKWVKDYKEGKIPADSYTMADRAFCYRVAALREQPVFRPVPISVIGVGGVVFVGFGGEAFTSYGRIMRELCPEKFVISVVCANGYEGYLPTAEAFGQGGYEACSSFFMPSLEDEIVAAAKEMLEKLK
ncbi:MAG: hypothetical protein IJD70_08005 [Clostridia bacterium]|nr:hypothetical protein [Clostridia bacterium]